MPETVAEPVVHQPGVTSRRPGPRSRRVGEVHPVALPSGLEPGGFQLLLGLIGIVAPDRVAVVVQAGSLALEQRQEEVVTAAEEAVVLATVPDDLQPQVLDVEVSGPGHAADVQGDVIKARGLEGAAFALAGLGRRRASRSGPPRAPSIGKQAGGGTTGPAQSPQRASRRCRVA